MGMFSWFCKGGCGKPIKGDEEVIQILSGTYDGYGRANGQNEYGAFYHEKCFRKLHGDVDTTEGDYDPNQGFGYPDPEFLPEGTKLYDDRYECFKGAKKVGVLLDMSGGQPYQVIRAACDPLAGVEAALHYLGVNEVEVIAFDYKVLHQETLPADHLYRVRSDRKKWSILGGGTDVRPAIQAALDAGCEALVIVSDLYMPVPDDPGVPVIWICSVLPSLIHENYEAGKRGEDLYDGAPKAPFGEVVYVENCD